MMELKKLIEEYEKNSLKLHNEEDFGIKKKCIDKKNKILKKVYDKHLEKDFFEYLFNSTEPFVLADIASDSLAKKYNIHKAYEIRLYLKDNANTLTFSSNPNINEKAKEFYSECSLLKYEFEIDMYNKFNDEVLYKKFHEYSELILKQYDWLTDNDENNPWDTEIESLLTNINNQDKLNEFLEIASDIYDSNDFNISSTINLYYVYKYTNNKEYAVKTLEKILEGTDRETPPDLRRLANKYLEVITE